MRLVLLLRTLSPSGGTQRYAVDLVRALAALGVSVQVICQRIEPDSLLPERVNVYRVPKLPENLLNRLWFLVYSWWLASRLVRLGQTDLRLSLDRSPFADAVRLGGGCHAAHLETLDGFRAGSLPLHGGLRLKDRLFLMLERRLVQSPCILTVSRACRRQLLERYPLEPNRVHVLNNGVDLDRFDPTRWAGVRQSVHHALGLSDDALVLLFVGHDGRRKGLELLLHAFFGVARRRPELELVLLGVGKDAPRLLPPWLKCTRLPGRARVLAFPRAQAIPGLESQDPLPGVYALADLFVFPTRFEPFGNVCLEAMSMGLPGITTESNGVIDLLGLSGAGNAHGWTVLPAPTSALELERALWMSLGPEHLSIQALRQALQARGQQARALAQQHGVQAHARALLALLQTSLGSAQAGA